MTITKNQRVTLMNKPFQQYHHQEHEQQQQYIPQQHHHHEATNFNQTITCTKPNRNMKKFIVNNHHQAQQQQHIPTQQQQQQYNECNKTQFNPHVTDNYNKKKSAITTSQDQGFISSKTSSNMNNLNPISSSSNHHHLLNPTTLTSTTCNNPTTTTTTHHTNNNNQGFCLILDTQATNIHSNQSLQMHFRCKKSYKDYTVEDISQYFHLPIKEVANNLSVSVTFLKKVCRRLNISRWPYRKVSSLNKKSSSSTSLDSNNNNNISIPTNNNNNNNINININIDSKIITEDHSSSSFSTQSNESSSLTSSSNNNNMLMMNNNTSQQRVVTTSPMSMYTNAHPYSNYDNNNNVCKDSGILENHWNNNIIHKENNIHVNHTNASMYSNGINSAKDIKNPSSESSPTTTYSSSTVNAFNQHHPTTPQYNVSFNHHTMRDSSKYCTFDSYCSPPPFNTNSMFESTCSKKMMEYNSIPVDEKRRGSIDSIIDRRGSVDQNEIICSSSSSNYHSSNSSFEKASVNNSNESKIFRDFTSKEVIYLPSFNDFCKQAGL